MFWTKLLLILTTIFIGWMLYSYVHRNPEAFSKGNLEKSLFALGILALFLIGFIAVCVLIVRG
ncbi:MAG: hypothetical protein WCW01_05675 [Gammaproteobacteria bacterium]